MRLTDPRARGISPLSTTMGSPINILKVLLPKVALLNRRVNQKKYQVSACSDPAFTQIPAPQGEMFRIRISKKMQIDIGFFMQTFFTESPSPWYTFSKTSFELSEHMVYRFLFIEDGQVQDSISIPPALKELYSLTGILYLSCRRRIEELQKKEELARQRKLKSTNFRTIQFIKKIK